MVTQAQGQANNQLEFIKLKVFLYKYTPLFEAQSSDAKDFLKTAQFKIDLDSPYFSKYDVTKFITGYTFEQSLDGNTYSWSITFTDPSLTPEVMRTDLKADVENPAILNSKRVAGLQDRTRTPIELETNLLNNLVQYELPSTISETDATNNVLFDTTEVGVRAKLNRGHAENDLVTKDSPASQIIAGIRLSDVIQPYDMLSVFLYKEATPIEDLRGTKVLITGTPEGTEYPQFVVSPTGLQTLKAEDFQKETILLSPISDVPGKTLFSNELNGFVSSKTLVRRIGGVDSVRITGFGITRLFGATRRIIKSSLLQDSIYSIAETNNVKELVAYQTTFADQSVEEILISLFRFVYHINFDVVKTTEKITGQTGSGQTLSGSSQIVTGFQFNSSFYDLTELQLGNLRQVNSFTIPPFLLGQVMRRRLFNYRQVAQPTEFNLPVLDSLLLGQSDTDGVLNSHPEYQEVYNNGKSPVLFDESIAGLRVYFRYMDEVLRFFNPETKTPFEILDEIKRITFVEIFERPDGVIIVRNPQYNSVSDVVFSSDLDVIEATYTETTDNLLSKMKAGYGLDFLPNGLPVKEFGFTDGKFLLQYGFLEGTTDVNPNVKNDTPSDNQITLDRDGIIFRYCEFFLRVHNAQLKTGTVTANLNPNVQVGDTFFDEKNQKFGYIVGLSKGISIGQTATMTLSLSYVRDAYDTTPGEKLGASLVFEKLPTLTEITA